MELSLRLDTLGMVEVRYLCGGAFFPLSASHLVSLAESV